MERRFTPAKLSVVACSVVLVAGYVWWRSGGREDMRIFSSSKSARLSRMRAEPPDHQGAQTPQRPSTMKSPKSGPVLDLGEAVFDVDRFRVIPPSEPLHRQEKRMLMPGSKSNNLDGDGQNIAYTDAVVEWFNTPFSSTQPSTQPLLLPTEEP